jgi:hypothetical protein
MYRVVLLARGLPSYLDEHELFECGYDWRHCDHFDHVVRRQEKYFYWPTDQ